jgi:hypothetical protein
MATDKRANFSLIRKKYEAIGKGNVRLTPSTMYLTQLIAATKSAYTFDVLENQTGTLQPNEIRLNSNDEFVVSHIGVMLEGTYGALATSPKIRFSYAPIELSTNCGTVLDLYNGFLKIGVNNIIYLDKWDTKKCEKNTFTQFTNQVVGTSASAHPSNDWSSDTMIPLSSLLTLSGAKKNEVTIQLPTAIAPVLVGVTYSDTGGAPTQIIINRVAIRFFGLLAQNGAKFQN